MRPKELVESWVEAFNRGSADEMASFYAEDAVNHQVARDPVSGRDAIRAARSGMRAHSLRNVGGALSARSAKCCRSSCSVGTGHFIAGWLIFTL
jgi:uncharacterized protein (TIGR02246 family)